MWGSSNKLYCQRCGAVVKQHELRPCVYCGCSTFGSKHPKDLVTHAAEIGPDMKWTENDKRFLRSLRIGLD